MPWRNRYPLTVDGETVLMQSYKVQILVGIDFLGVKMISAQDANGIASEAHENLSARDRLYLIWLCGRINDKIYKSTRDGEFNTTIRSRISNKRLHRIEDDLKSIYRKIGYIIRLEPDYPHWGIYVSWDVVINTKPQITKLTNGGIQYDRRDNEADSGKPKFVAQTHTNGAYNALRKKYGLDGKDTTSTV